MLFVCSAFSLVEQVAWRYQDQKDKQDQSVEGGVKLHKGRPGTKAGSRTLTTGCRPPPPTTENIWTRKLSPSFPLG